MGPVEICQDFDKLAMIDRYTYDMTDAGFVEYADSRGVLQLARVGEYYDMVADHSTDKARFEDYCRRNDRPGRPWSFEYEVESHWEAFLAVRGSMQDIWEIYYRLPRTVDGIRVKRARKKAHNLPDYLR